MNKKISLDQSTIKILYYKNKEFILPTIIILVCSILFLELIFPQIQEVTQMKENEKLSAGKINVYKNNLNFISSLNNQALDSQLQTVSSALPIEKDYIGIINALSMTSALSGVALDDFGFEVGNLSTKSAATDIKPSIKISFTIKGSMDNTRAFLKNINEKFPISEVKSLQFGNEGANFSAFFYYKPYSQIQAAGDVPLANLSNDKKNMLEKIKSWKGGSEDLLLPIENSASANENLESNREASHSSLF